MAGIKGILRNMVRYDPTMGPEGTFLMRCDSCVSRGESTAYWPLTLEFWLPSQGLQRCRACHRHKKRAARRLTIEQKRAKSRWYYARDREHRLQYARDYLDGHREYINEQRRIRYAAKTAARKAAA